jgi:ABC-type transporter Mla MlaB component
MAKALHPGERLSSWRKMTLRIDRVGERVRLSGDLRYEHLHQVKAEMDQCGSRCVLDLEEVARVDVEAVHFLNSCEARGVSVLNASAYIRAWMVQERERPTH